MDDTKNSSNGSTATAPDPTSPPSLTVERGGQPAALPSDPTGTVYMLQGDGSTVATLPNGTVQRRAPQGVKFLTKKEIVDADDSGYEDVHVPEWGGWVRVKRLTAAERGQIEAAQVTIDKDGESKWDGKRLRELFCQAAVVDPATGTRLFSSSELHMLGRKSAAALDRVYESATKQARVTKRDIAELSGNSDSDLSDTSHGGTAKR